MQAQDATQLQAVHPQVHGKALPRMLGGAVPADQCQCPCTCPCLSQVPEASQEHLPADNMLVRSCQQLPRPWPPRSVPTCSVPSTTSTASQDAIASQAQVRQKESASQRCVDRRHSASSCQTPMTWWVHSATECLAHNTMVAALQAAAHSLSTAAAAAEQHSAAGCVAPARCMPEQGQGDWDAPAAMAWWRSAGPPSAARSQDACGLQPANVVCTHRQMRC